jgi:DNA polymerase-3 subunit gamma/tau
VDHLLGGDTSAGLKRINSALEQGLDLRQLNRQVVEHLRDLLVMKSGAGQGEGSLLDVTAEMKGRLEAQAKRVQLPELLRWLGVFSEADATLRLTVYGQLPLEMAFVACTLPAQVGAGAPQPQVESVVPLPKEVLAPARSHVAEPRAAGRSAVPTRQVEASLDKTPINSGASANGRAESDVAPYLDPPREPSPVADAVAEAPAAPQQTRSESLPAPAASGELRQLEAGWGDVVEQIRARNPKMAIVYANPDLVRPVVVSEGICTLAFRDAIYVQRSMVNDARSPNRDIVEAALSKVLGRATRIECITMKQYEAGNWGDDPRPTRPGARSNSERSSRPARETPSPYTSSRGKAAMNIFGIEKFDD